MKKSIISNFGTSFGIVVLGLIGSIIMARTLGPEKRGDIAAAILWPNLLLYLGSFGTYQSFIFYYSKKRNDTLMWGCCLVATFFNSIISIATGIFFIYFFLGNASEEVKFYSIILLASLPFSILSQFITSILQAKLKFRHFNIIRLFFPISYLLVLVGLYVAERFTFSQIILAQVYLNIILCLISVFFYRRYIGSIIPVYYNSRVLKLLYKYGFKVWAGDLSQGLNLRLDQILISNFFSTRQLGYYVVAQSIANFTTILANSFRTIILPTVAKSSVVSEKIRIVKKSLLKFNIVNAIMIISSIVLVPVLIVWIYGSAFQSSVYLSILLLCGFLFLNIKTVISAGLLGLGYPWYVSKSEFSGLIVLVALIYPFSKWYGINGAAIAIAISYFIQYLVVHLLFKKIESKLKT